MSKLIFRMYLALLDRVYKMNNMDILYFINIYIMVTITYTKDWMLHSKEVDNNLEEWVIENEHSISNENTEEWTPEQEINIDNVNWGAESTPSDEEEVPLEVEAAKANKLAEEEFANNAKEIETIKTPTNKEPAPEELASLPKTPTTVEVKKNKKNKKNK